MDSNLFSFLVLAAVAVVTPTAILLLSFIAGPSKKKLATKLTPYECGVKPFESARGRFSVKFYLVAMLFIQPFTNAIEWIYLNVFNAPSRAAPRAAAVARNAHANGEWAT